MSEEVAITNTNTFIVLYFGLASQAIVSNVIQVSMRNYVMFSFSFLANLIHFIL